MDSWRVKLVLVFLLGYLLLRFGPGIPINSIVTQKTDLFTVSGEGKVTVVPDEAKINLGITVNKPTVKAAQNEANTVMKNLTSALKKLGVDDKDVKTSNYSIYPQIDYQNGNRVTGFQVDTNVEVTVRNLDNLSLVIDAATANGANSVGGVQLTVNDAKMKELLQQARELAVKEAKTKAEGLAKAAGLTLGKIVNVTESGNAPPPGPVMANYEKISLDMTAPTQINPGSSDITSSVTLVYETR